MGQSPPHEGFTAPWVIGQYVSSLHVYADGVGDVLESVAAQQLGQTALQHGDLLRARYISELMNMTRLEPERIFA